MQKQVRIVRRSHGKAPVLAAVAIAVIGSAVGCSSSSTGSSSNGKSSAPPAAPAPAPLNVSVTANHDVSGLPPSIAAGTYTITTSPADQGMHQIQLVHLAPGYTQQQLITDVGKSLNSSDPATFDKPSAERLYAQALFTGGTAGSGSQSATVFLPAGDYVYGDVGGNGGAPKLQSFVVTSGANAAALPMTPVTITGADNGMNRYQWQVQGALAQSGTFTFRDISKDEPHFLVTAKLKPGKTADDCFNFQGDPSDPKSPCTPSAQTALISQNTAETVPYKLDGPGTYVLACFVADPDNGKVHAMEGMQTTVTVS